MPSGLVEDEPIADRSRSALLRIRLRMHASGDGQSELELLVDDRVAADDDRTGLVHLVLPAAQDLGEHVDRELVQREIRRCSAR